MKVIILTANEAVMVRGLSPWRKGYALVPVAIADGRFKLGPSVVDDPAFAHVRHILASLPQEDDIPARTQSEAEIVKYAPSLLEVWTHPSAKIG